MMKRLSTDLAVLVLPVLLIACGASGTASESPDDTPRTGQALEVKPSPYWKSAVAPPFDEFGVYDSYGQPGWIKLSIHTSDLKKVYFQDGRQYRFHYDFARKHLPGFENLDTAAFDAVTQRAQGQALHLGALVLAPQDGPNEVGIQLIRQDPYAKEEVKALFDAIAAQVTSALPSLKFFYLPTYEQRAAAERDRAWLEANGIVIASADRWANGDACYSTGWAFGTLKYFSANDIEAAYLDGRLSSRDILLTDGVPAEVPYVAGIISLSAATPNSHAAILSRTWGIPFAFPSSAAGRARLQSLDGKEVVARAQERVPGATLGCTLTIVEPAVPLDAATRADLAALRAPPKVTISARARLGALTRSTDALKPADVKYFGGKASNFGSLRRSIPEHSPKALGVSFDLWDAFISQQLTTGKTLKGEIDARLSSLKFPVEPRELEPALEELRRLVRSEAVMPPAEGQRLLSELVAFGFDPKTKLRFRSSTNVEDGEVLSGAGLYDSYSGCLADDLDDDSTGPSACDASEPNERGVFRAISRVFASFFNTNAVLERLKYGVEEDTVGMAMVVHPSYPDVIEAANGVATVALDGNVSTILLVSQPGAVSVTNPEVGETPEEVRFERHGDWVSLSYIKGSSLLPLGARVMVWESDYRALAELILKASGQFLEDHASTGRVVLDLEYKKTTSGALEVKQIRHLPQPNRDRKVHPVLIPDGTPLCREAYEGGRVLAEHRLKASFTPTYLAGSLTRDRISSSLLADAKLEILERLTPVQRSGAPASWPGATHSVEAEWVWDRWTGTSNDRFGIGFSFPREVPASEPILFSRDLWVTVAVDYASPQPSVDYDGTISNVSREIAKLAPCSSTLLDGVRTVEVTSRSGVKVTTQYQYVDPQSPFAKTFFVGRFLKTVITGLTSEPIVLTSDAAHSHVPHHHNFEEDFLFDPALEPGLPASIRAELEARDIRLLVVSNVSADGGNFFALSRTTGALTPLD